MPARGRTVWRPRRTCVNSVNNLMTTKPLIDKGRWRTTGAGAGSCSAAVKLICCFAVLPCLAAGESVDYQHHLRQIEAQVGSGFHFAIEPPFVLVSDQSAADFKDSRENTVRWAVRLLRQDFFEKDPSHIITVYLFYGRESYLAHAKEFFDEQPDTPFGYYSRMDQALIMNIDTGNGTLVHEIVHPFMEANFPDCPAWFDEGLGSLFERSTERDGHLVGLVNWRLRELHRGMRRNHVVPLADLIATSSAEFYENPHGMHYAEARYLLYYLQEQGKLHEFYRRFVANSADDPTGANTLCSVMGVADLDQLQTHWLEYVDGLRLP